MSTKQIPWQERPEGCSDVMWRYSLNPIIGRYDIPTSNSIFNSAVVPFEDGFAGVFRCDNKSVQMNIFAGFSKDGLKWDINHEPIQMKAGNTQMIDSDYKYDPRVTISKNFSNVKMHFYLLIEMVCFSLKKSMENMQCLAVQVIMGILLLEIFI